MILRAIIILSGGFIFTWRTVIAEVAHYVELIRSVIHDASHIWLRRTAYISLILLNDKYYEKQYLELIKNDSAECLCNIGDLLRYYGDMERLMQLMWIRKS